MRHGRHHLAAAAAAIGFFAFASAASAETLCLNAPGCTEANTFTSFATAVAAAGSDTTPDTLKIGAREEPYPTGGVYSRPGDVLNVEGAGIGQTTLRASGGTWGFTLEGGGTIKDLSIDGTTAGRALRLVGGHAERVRVYGESSGQTLFSGVYLDNGASFEDGSIDVPETGISRATAVTGPQATVSRTTIRAKTGIEIVDGSLGIDHVRVEARRGVRLADGNGTTSVSDSAFVIPPACVGSDCIGLAVDRAALSATRVTIAGPSTAIGGRGGDAPLSLNGQLSLVDSIVHTAGGHDLVKASGTVSATNTSFSRWSGGVTVFQNHFSGDPRFADPAAGDLRLRGDSPLIDQAAGTMGGTDAAGLAREVDGDGDGLVRPDLGAHERQDWTATATGPAAGVAQRAVAFTGAAPGTVPNDPLSWEWKFDDGGTASGRDVTHVFATPGAHTATLTVTDGAGVQRTATALVTLAAAPDRPGGQPPGGQPPDGTPPADLTPPALGLALPRQRIGKKGLALTLTPSEACAVTLALRIDRKTARRLGLGRKARTIGKLAADVQAGKQTLRVKLTARVRKALARSRKPVRLSLGGTVRDAAGNTAPFAARLTLRR